MIDKFNLKVNILELVLVIILFFALFVFNMFSRNLLAIILLIYAIISVILLKKRNTLSIYNRQVTMIMFVFSIIYLIINFLTGLYFGFYKNTDFSFLFTLKTYIIPFSIIIISSEIIRFVFLSQKTKISKILTFIAMVLIDISIYSQVYDITQLQDFLTMLGFIIFSSIAGNLLYNYISVKYGHLPIIIYRLITILYVYIAPILPDTYVFFRTSFRIIYPYIMYLFLEHIYTKEKQSIANVSKVRRLINTIIVIVVVMLIVMIISCNFWIGIIVVGSGSMTGTINKGDAVIFVQYSNQNIEEQDVIVFNKDDIQLIHRVIDIKNINGEKHYYTKGDANQKIDDGYITDKDIVGISKFRIKYLGYPSLWVRDIFENN